MVYIHVKKIGNNNYYSLRNSVRKGNKVISQDICSLGNDLSKVSLKKLQIKHKGLIKNSYKTINKKLYSEVYLEKSRKKYTKVDKYLSKNQLIEINAVLMHFREKFNKKRMFNNFNSLFITENTFIDGNLLKKQDILNILKKGIRPKNKSLKEMLRITNTKKVLEFLQRKKLPLKLSLIEKIHRMFLENLSRLKGYRYYKIKINGHQFNSFPEKDIKQNLKELIKWFYRKEDKINTLVLVSLFHNKFEKIHPFFDGNGEIGRILMNYILFLKDYPPIIIPSSLKEEYFNCLKKADKGIKKDLFNSDVKYYKPLINFMQKQFVKTYWNNFLVND